MKVKNKWNNKLYTVKLYHGCPDYEVTLIREDGSEFTISQKEYRYNYKEVEDGHGNNSR